MRAFGAAIARAGFMRQEYALVLGETASTGFWVLP
jgi:hypothetical protein